MTPAEFAMHPPLDPLLEIGARLDRAGIVWALGGSGLLLALGLVDRANDWDLTCGEPADRVATIFEDIAHERSGASGVHADEKIVFTAERTELICRFAFFTPAGVTRIPTLVSARWRGVPLVSPEAWAAAYALMGELESSAQRRERGQVLFTHLARTGANREVVEQLLEQPLTPWVRARLRELL
ncbi:MAG: hypothetical protein HYR73_00970 [Candidatus Eisenbacteria bacterium]|nr:hypothetical protein [Candidatus Eisenbacteria bacterium]